MTRTQLVVFAIEKQLQELLRHPEKRSNAKDVDVLHATAELTEAKRQLGEKEIAYEAIRKLPLSSLTLYVLISVFS